MSKREILQKEMHLNIEKFGILDTRTIEKSQELDKEIVREQQEIYKQFVS